MNILVHNAVMEEELPAGGCSVFTIFHVAAIDTRNRVCVCVCVCGRGGRGLSTYVHMIVAYRDRVSIIEGRLNYLHSLAGFSQTSCDVRLFLHDDVLLPSRTASSVQRVHLQLMSEVSR